MGFRNLQEKLEKDVFFQEKLSFREKITVILTFRFLNEQIKTNDKFHGKKSGFVDSGFGKSCDELIIAPLPLPILWNPIP